MSAPIQTEPESWTGSDTEGGHVHTCIMHREVCVQRAYLPTKTAQHGCSLRATHRTVYFIREWQRETIWGFILGRPTPIGVEQSLSAPCNWSNSMPFMRGALAAQEFLFAKASLQYIKTKDLPRLLSHVLTGLPPGKAVAPGKGFSRNAWGRRGEAGRM